jgi:hypothetical protein
MNPNEVMYGGIDQRSPVSQKRERGFVLTPFKLTVIKSNTLLKHTGGYHEIKIKE